MGKLLTRRQIQEYREQGFLAPIDVIDEAEAAVCLQRLQEAEARYPQHFNAENRNNPHLVLTCFDQLAFHPRVLDAVEDLIGPDFSLWGSVLFIKEPGSPHFVSWHQDATYAGVEPHDYVTPWIALTPSNLDSGCMSMIPGSHVDPVRRHEETFADDNILTRGQQIADIDESSKVDLILRPGQMSLHHARVIHGSLPNRSTARRVGFALQAFVASGGRQTIGENYWLPVRGNCRHDDMTRLQRPHADMDAAAIAERDRANRNWAQILYHGASRRRAY